MCRVCGWVTSLCSGAPGSTPASRQSFPTAAISFLEKVPAAIVVGNGFGKLLGSTQVNELGELETPILLTGTLNVPKVADGLISYMLSAARDG